jgi:hypothetical protein
MKRYSVSPKVKIVVLALVFTGTILFVIIKVFRDLSYVAWMNGTPASISRIAKEVEFFKDQTGNYPQSLSELTTNKQDFDREYLTYILSHGPNQYFYQLVSNGFVIKVVSPPSLINSRKEMVRQFAPGEALIEVTTENSGTNKAAH